MKRWSLKHRPTGALSGEYVTRAEARKHVADLRRLGSHLAQYVTPVKCEVEIKEVKSCSW